MSEQPTQCTSVAELVVDGNRAAGFLQCTEPAGHEVERPYWFSLTGRHYDTPPAAQLGHPPHGTEPGTPHRVVLTWADDDDVEVSTTLPPAIDLEPGTTDDDIEPEPPVDPGPHPDSVAGHIAAITRAVDDIVTASAPVGLCNVEGCVYLAGHDDASPHSWARGLLAGD